jgi:phosphoribosylformylglycinamidine cyclo-ligase
MSRYEQRGVSAQKEEVHRATAGLSAGLYPNAFCKLYPDFLTGHPAYVSTAHADGAGTKSILAYLYWKETGDLSVWEGIAQDAIVMNLDDLLCVGMYDQFLFSSTIDRNKHRIPGEVLTAVIQGSKKFIDEMAGYGIHIHFTGGETADVGDLVRTITVNGTLTARWPKNCIIHNERIQPGDCIIGLSSHGQANYERVPNSGIGSNGLTAARHDMLHKEYATQFPETYEAMMDEAVVYSGQYRLTDPVPGENSGFENIGKLLLSPTRTYAPVLKVLLQDHFEAIHGLIHCSGGGQTKCLKYMPELVRVVKDQLFEPPVVFQLIQEQSGASVREMYEVFNMGTRMEIYCAEADTNRIIEVIQSFGIAARVIGRVEKDVKKSLQIDINGQSLFY